MSQSDTRPGGTSTNYMKRSLVNNNFSRTSTFAERHTEVKIKSIVQNKEMFQIIFYVFAQITDNQYLAVSDIRDISFILFLIANSRS